MRRVVSLAVLSLLPLLGGWAGAATLQVSNTTLRLSAAQPADATTLSNEGLSDTVVQADIMRWTQHNGQDVLEPTRDVLAVPPLFTLKAGSSQVVRLVLRNKQDAGQEGSYRLVLHEVPPAGGPSGDPGASARVVLRLSLPVFVFSRAPARGEAGWSVSVSGDQLLLRLQNTTNTHLKVSGLRLNRPGERAPLLDERQLAYALPGQTREWRFPLPLGLRGGDTLELQADTDTGTRRATLVVAP